MYFDSCLRKDMEHERELMIVCGLQTKAGTCLGLFFYRINEVGFYTIIGKFTASETGRA